MTAENGANDEGLVTEGSVHQVASLLSKAEILLKLRDGREWCYGEGQVAGYRRERTSSGKFT